MTPGATRPICCCRDGETRLAPAVLPFADAVERIRSVRRLRACRHRRAPAPPKRLGRDFALSTVRQPDALWVARLARQLPATDAPPGPLYLRAPDAKLPAQR